MKSRLLILCVLLMATTTGCGRLYGEKGIVSDRSQAYLQSQDGVDLQVPEKVSHRPLSDDYRLPQSTDYQKVDIKPPGMGKHLDGKHDREISGKS